MATKRKYSPLWNHFEEVEPGKKARCNYCSRTLAVSLSSIGSLRRHIKSIHPTIQVNSSTQPASFPDRNVNSDIEVELDLALSSCSSENSAQVPATTNEPSGLRSRQTEQYLSDLKAKLKRDRIKWKQNSDGTGPIICNAEDFTDIKLRMLQVLRKDALNSQDSNNYNTSDFETEDSPSYEDDHNDNYGMVVFPLKESKDEIKTTYKSGHITCIPNETRSSEPHTHVFMNHNECGDEFDTFGRNVAQQLKTLPLPVALQTQEMLLSVIRKQRLKVLNESNGNSDPLE